MVPDPVRVGVVGCGAISRQYLAMARQLPILRIEAVADLDPERARARAEEFDIPRALPVDDLLADPEIEVVLNLTVPKAHAPVALAALEQGKHVFGEKPLALTREEGEQVLETAARRGLRVGCAPDTFLGAGLQAARAAVDAGRIGRPVAFAAAMMCPGHERWHPNPEFYYQPGGGPMLDMGPYYLTALLNLLGPARRIAGLASVAFPERVVGAGPRAGARIPVETPDHVCALLEFENGAVGTLVTSFAALHPVHDRELPITLWGTEGVLKVPDPNRFDGPVLLRGRDAEDWEPAPHRFHSGYGRAVGLAEMAWALRLGRPHRADGGRALAVLDLMLGSLESSATGCAHLPRYPFVRPEPLPTDRPFGVLDA